MIATPADIDELLALYPDEAACAELFASVRWPGGFRCACGGRGCRLAVRPRVWQCYECNQQTSVTAGTLFERCRDLRGWLIATYAMACEGTTAATLERFLGVHAETAWLMFHTLRQALFEPRPPMTGEITATIGRMDGSTQWLRKHYPTVDPGDGPFVAVAASADGEVRMEEVPSRGAPAILDVAGRWFAAGSTLRMLHPPLHELRLQGVAAPAVLPRDRKQTLGPVEERHGDVRIWLNGVFNGVSRRWLGRYLVERAWRENRPAGNRMGDLLARALARPPGLLRPPPGGPFAKARADGHPVDRPPATASPS